MIRFRRSSLPVLSLVILLPALVVSAREPSPVSKDGRGPQGIFVVDGSPVHDVGNLWVHASNWGAIGSMPGSGTTFQGAPSAQWPGGSDVEYLYIAGLWVGGLVSGVPAVSTSAYQIEFRPSQDPRDIVYATAFGVTSGQRVPSVLADDDMDGMIDEDILDGFDNDGDGQIDEDFAAISNQMLSRNFRDDQPGTTDVYPQHNPMHLAVHEESYQFGNPGYDDFVGFTFRITNQGSVPVENVYLGLFADGDVGNRNTSNYWEDDATAYRADLTVDHGVHGTQAYDFAYWYDVDGDGGEAPGYCGIVILDHPTDPTGVNAPVGVGAVTYASFSGAASYEDGGDPTNDFERYELLSSETIERDSVVPRDERSLIVAGPFASIAPGETISFSVALVVTPRGDFSNVVRAAEAYHGLWFDLDHDPATGIDGKEHQEHWYLPTENPVPLAITRFDAGAEAGAVRLAWETYADERIERLELLRAVGDGDLSTMDAAIAASATSYLDRSVEPGVRYDYQLVAHGAEGWTAVSPRVSATVPAAGLALRQNTPNPFSGATDVSFTLPQRGTVRISVYDVAGRHVTTLFAGEQGAGDHTVSWNGTDDAGQRVGAGIYFCRVESGTKTLTRKMVLVR